MTEEELPTLTVDGNLIEEMIFPKEVSLKYQLGLDGTYRIQLNKRYRDRTDVVKVDYLPTGSVGDLLKWFQQALHKLNRREV